MRNLSDEVLHGDLASVRAALKRGSDVNQLDQYGSRPLILAAQSGKLSVTRYLLEHGAWLEEPDHMGCTALYWAVDFAHKSVIRALLEAGANPNAYTPSGQPLMVYPFLRKDEDIIELLVEHGGKLSFAQDYINTKLVGHRYELENFAYILNLEHEYLRVSFEGFFLEFTVSAIKDSLQLFIQSPEGKKFSGDISTIPTIIHALRRATDLRAIKERKLDHRDYKSYIDGMLSKEPLILPVAYQGHAITFVKYGAYLAHCDRGELSKRRGSVCIYRIHNPRAFSHAFCKRVLYERSDKQFIYHDIQHILGLEEVFKIPTESQVAGNCSWANVEASVAVLLFMLSKPDYSNRRDTLRLREDALTLHAAWVEWDKDRALDRMIANYHKVSKARRAAKAAILGAVLFQRCHHSSSRDVERARKILDLLSHKDYRYVVEGYLKVYADPKKMTKRGFYFRKLLKKCNYPL